MSQLSRRNRMVLGSLQARANLRFALARVGRLDWPSAANAILASFAVLGGCHSAAHTAEFRSRISQPVAQPTGGTGGV